MTNEGESQSKSTGLTRQEHGELNWRTSKTSEEMTPEDKNRIREIRDKYIDDPKARKQIDTYVNSDYQKLILQYRDALAKRDKKLVEELAKQIQEYERECYRE